MNSRKFYFIVSSILSVCLFLTGTVLLANIVIPDNNIDSSRNLIDIITDPIKNDNGPVNILVLGGDQVASNTDTMILVNFNPVNSKMSMMSIPRDTKVNVKGSSLPKINSAYAVGGGKQAVETVSSLLNVKIKYYVFINTKAFRQIIDTLDGVDYNVPVDMNYDDPTQDLHIHLKKGMQHMDGAKAEQFMRFRQPNSYNNEIMKYYDGGDIKRINAQQNFIKEIIRQKANLKYISKADDIIRIVFKNIDTNITMADAVKLSQSLGKLNVNEINTFTLPGQAQENGAWYYIMDAKKAQEIIKEYFISKEGFIPGKNTNNKPLDNSKPKSTAKPTAKPTQKPTEKPIVTATPVPTVTPEIKPTPTPELTPAPTPVDTPTPTVAPNPTSTPFEQPTPSHISNPTTSPATPTATPTNNN